MSQSPKLLVLLATYNGLQNLTQQIVSLNDQINIDMRIDISDDTSDDGSYQYLQKLCLKDSRFNLLQPVKSFSSAGRNFFRLFRDTDFSNTQYIALSDQDDIWLPTKLSRAIIKLNANQADAYSSNVTAFWSDGIQRLINKAQPQRQYDFMFESAGPGCTFVLTQKLALKIQAFLIANQNSCKDVALHDWFIYAFARSLGYKWVIDSESHMLYRQHAENVVGANVGLKAKYVRFKKLRAGWVREQALLIAAILGYDNSAPIQKLQGFSLIDRLWLIANVTKLRRRLRDQMALALYLLVSRKKD